MCCVVFLGKVLGTTCVCGGLGVVGVWSRVCVCVGGGGRVCVVLAAVCVCV